MKKLGLSLAVAIGAAGAANAADLPTTKAPLPAPVNCFASFWTWLNSTPAECPLSYAGFALYGTVDAGLGYESNGAGYNQHFNNGVANVISRASTHGPQWLWTPNGLSQSVVGLKMSEDLGGLGLPGWSLIGTAETGFNPFLFNLAYSQKSLVQNNGKSVLYRDANGDSSRTGQPFNSQIFIGLSNKTYGTLTVGRVNTLSLDAFNSYDPMSSSYAFSPIGYSGSYAGFGDTEAARANTAVKYRVAIQNYRLGGLWQWGGYDQGNAATGLYQGEIGGDFALPNGGALSLDGIASYGKNEVSVSAFGGLTQCSTLTKGQFAGQFGCIYGPTSLTASNTTSIPLFYNNTDFRATLSNNTGFAALAKYKWQQWTLYGAYEYIRQQNPSGDFPNGFETIGYFNVPATIPGYNIPGTIANRLFPTQWVINNAYNIPRRADVFWVGVKYSFNPQLDVIAAFYELSQNNYNFTVPTAGVTRGITTPAACTNESTTVNTAKGSVVISRVSSGKCAGTTDFLSFLIDYRPVSRVTIYAGVMESNVYAGLANGYFKTQTINPTAGIRIKF